MTGNRSSFVTTHGFNLHSPSYDMGGESHRLAQGAPKGFGYIGNSPKRNLPRGCTASRGPVLRSGRRPVLCHRPQCLLF